MLNTMVVCFEFLDNEPIENVITCIHFKVDKVVFFGYHHVIQNQRSNTEKFLKKYCSVNDVKFFPLPLNDLQSVLKTMRKEIEHELGQGAKLYFDITGGESLILVAFGMLSKEFETPMHMYDIPNDKLIELDEGAKLSISKDVVSQQVHLNLDRYIEMRGGIINYGLHKSIKKDGGEEFIDDVAKMWLIAKKHIDYWNPFSDFLRVNMLPDTNLQVRKRTSRIIKALSESKTNINKTAKLNEIIDDLAEKGLLLDVDHANEIYRFRFKNQYIKDCLWEGGSILELHTYQKQKIISDDCRVGVHLDWDGIIHYQRGTDVINEIDVLSLKGNVPTFISCKSGKMGAQQALHALYELETVTKRFGGKYAKKVLVTAVDIGKVYSERASEMGIEIITC